MSTANDTMPKQGPEGPGPKPAWLKKPLPKAAAMREMETLLRARRLHTVCESARCPNKGECFERGTATFLIMGGSCTRDCPFCSVESGRPGPLDPDEPEQVAAAAATMGLRHVVVTSVTRDDLPDGGAGHFVATMQALRERLPHATVEVLVPDFLGSRHSLDLVLNEAPEVFNHNVETVPRLYLRVRPQADYGRSLDVLRYAAECGGSVVKTGLMVGLGETAEEVRRLLTDAVDAGVALVTIGQYLRPSREHLPVIEYVHPARFEEYREYGEKCGLQVEAAPFVRSSYRAEEGFRRQGAGRIRESKEDLC
ncbi:MAG: lipoyl synthase [Thermoleophilia bacterium]|nr:lipoyl synthase [Thermoleophilia bacterium]